MKPVNPLLLLVVGAVFIVALLLAVFFLIPTAPSAPAVIPACGAEPHFTNPIPVPSGQTVLVGSSGGGGRMTIWSNSTASYSLFLLTQNQYDSYATNGSGINGSIHYGPPSNFYWTTGPTTLTNNTFLFQSGTWYLMVYNPGTADAIVNVIAESCNAPNT
jgi:hypothetical protein